MSKATVQQQLDYLDRIKRAAKQRDWEMLKALYAQCDELDIIVPHYKIPELSAQKHNNYTINLPAIKVTEDGFVIIRQNECVEIDGVSRSIKEWCQLINLSRTALRARIQRGWPIEKALTIKPLRS